MTAHGRVRALGSDDHAAYRTIRLNALRLDPAAFGSSVEVESAFTDDEWRARVIPPGGIVLGVDGADGLVATGAVIVDGDDPSSFVLVAMWTEPGHRGAGHGGRIVESAVGFARAAGGRRIRCSVTEGNTGAERLYAAHGFVRTGGDDIRESDGQRHVHMEIGF